MLNEWADSVPSVLALKAWEKEWHSAVNSTFIDFHNRSPLWPMMFWQAAKADKIPEDTQLTRLITRLVVSRIKPMSSGLKKFETQMAAWEQHDEQSYLESLMKVLEGERIVGQKFLDPKDIAPGDFFEVPAKSVEGTPVGENEFLLNIRSECDCARGNPMLYLVRGKVIDSVGGLLNEKIGNIDSMERHSEAIVLLMYQGKSISFSFRELEKQKWGELKASRCGRLLAPFLTRVTQRYAAYSNRPGLPRLPKALVDYLIARDVSPEAVDETHAEVSSNDPVSTNDTQKDARAAEPGPQDK